MAYSNNNTHTHTPASRHAYEREWNWAISQRLTPYADDERQYRMKMNTRNSCLVQRSRRGAEHDSTQYFTYTKWTRLFYSKSDVCVILSVIRTY